MDLHRSVPKLTVKFTLGFGMHTVYLPKMDASKVFFERSTDYHSQQRNLGFFLEFDYKANKGDISSGGPDQRPAF